MRKNVLLGLLFAATALPAIGPAVAAVAAADQTQLVEFYNKSLDHYFVTVDPVEMSALDTGFFVGWARTGFQFPVMKIGANVQASLPMCRFYGRPAAGIDSHFYSSKFDECEQVKSKFPNEWQFEAAEVYRAFAVNPTTGLCPVDSSPVYRLWNKRPDVNHRYTNQKSVYDAMITKGYTPEGDGNPVQPVAFCQPTGVNTVPPPAAGTPACTLAVNSNVPAVGSTLILTASCTNGPTAFSWDGCASTSNTCQVTRTTTGTAKYTVTASNANGPGAPQGLDVVWGGGGPVPVCSISANSTSPSVGSTLTLNASCSQTPTRIDWLDCNYLIQGICQLIPTCSGTSTSCAISTSLAGFARYAVAGANASGTGPRAAVDVEWKSFGGGGGGGGGTVNAPVCSVIASNENPNFNTSIVLSASCLNNPTSYSWSPISCSQFQCSTSSPTPGAITYSVTGSNSAGSSTGSITVNWGGTPPPLTPACTLAASSLTPTVGMTVNIISTCTNSPSTWVWTGCTGSFGSCSDTFSGTPGLKTYTLVASNGVGPSPTALIAINWQAAPTAVPSCTSVTPSNNTPFVGQSVVLTANCSSTNAPQTYTWTNCTGGVTSTSPTCTTTASTAGAQIYSVVGNNALGPSTPPVSTTVTWQPSTGGTDFCGSYPNVQRVNKNWGDNAPLYTQNNGGFAADGVFVVSFTVPSAPASYTVPNTTNVAEYNGPNTYRQMTLSKSSCDFRGIDPSGTSGPYRQGFGTTAGITWNVGAAPVALVAGQTYYFNFRNWNPDANSGAGGPSCGISACNAIIQMNYPH